MPDGLVQLLATVFVPVVVVLLNQHYQSGKEKKHWAEGEDARSEALVIERRSQERADFLAVTRAWQEQLAVIKRERDDCESRCTALEEQVHELRDKLHGIKAELLQLQWKLGGGER